MGGQNFQKKVAIFQLKCHFFFGNFRTKIIKNCQKIIDFQQKLIKSCRNLSKSTSDSPEKKCHLFRKIATFFENFDPSFSEKLTFSVKSPKKGDVPN